MLKATIAVIFIFFGSYTLFACDCSAGSIGIGLMSNYQLNQVSLAYLNSRFQSKSSRGSEFIDHFQKFELSGRYAVGKSKRYKLEMHIPVSLNNRNYSDESIKELGLSDIRSSVSYAILNNADLGKKSTIYLEAGLGLSFPTGKYDDNIHIKNLPANFNAGRGSLAWFGQLNAVIYAKNSGIVFSSSFMDFTKTPSGFSFGSQFVTDLTIFHEIRKKGTRYIPSLAVRMEGARKDRFANAKSDDNTGGNSILLSPAINVRFSNWLLGGTYSLMLKEKFSDDSSEFSRRIALRCTHIF